jgi:hypothetical protein
VFTALVRRPFLCVIQTGATTMQQQQHLVLAVHLLASIRALMRTVEIFGLPPLCSQFWYPVVRRSVSSRSHTTVSPKCAEQIHWSPWRWAS